LAISKDIDANASSLLSVDRPEIQLFARVPREYAAPFPSCHGIFDKLVKKFIRMRLYFLCACQSPDENMSKFSSKSVAGAALR
jgi:hypothetical protein